MAGSIEGNAGVVVAVAVAVDAVVVDGEGRNGFADGRDGRMGVFRS